MPLTAAGTTIDPAVRAAFDESVIALLGNASGAAFPVWNSQPKRSSC